METTKHLFAEMTWYEVKQAREDERVAVVPVAMIEEHGPHLPVDTDLVLVNEVCVRAGARIPEEMVVVPPVNHGYAPHQMDFPGVISISADTFISYVTDVCKSLAYQGFKRILLVNGHGSNESLLKVVARLTILDYPEAMCASISHWDFQPVIEAAEQIRESPEPGGMAHACELETSMYLAIKENLVQMDKAVKDMDKVDMPKYFWRDLVGSGQARTTGIMPYWSSISETGVLGDPTKATKEKGERFLEAAVEGLIDCARTYRELEYSPRVDHHDLNHDMHGSPLS